MSCTICLACARRATWSRGHDSGLAPSCKSLSIVVLMRSWVSGWRPRDEGGKRFGSQTRGCAGTPAKKASGSSDQIRPRFDQVPFDSLPQAKMRKAQRSCSVAIMMVSIFWYMRGTPQLCVHVRRMDTDDPLPDLWGSGRVREWSTGRNNSGLRSLDSALRNDRRNVRCHFFLFIPWHVSEGLRRRPVAAVRPPIHIAS